MNQLTRCLVALLLPMTVWAAPDCEQGNRIPTEKLAEARTLGAPWLGNALYCDFGVFQTLTPLDKKNDALIIFKTGKLFLIHQSGFGVNLFQQYGDSGSIPFLSVQDWNHDGVYERLSYSIVDKDGAVVGGVQDSAMDGKLDVRRYGRIEHE